ncbi:Multidrug transporter [Alteromonas macleodii]|uniref:EamA family transporter n=1 Tax=Alteromonas TaxID=226 RepID=UPI00057CF3F6|nr:MULTISPECIES: EamA family transporter [Alteromonas]MAL72090.1 multidrug transporter [Alteromonas sp.]MEC7480296.1 EamA family transporter [Pseudomonadota bacterium]AUI83435.1 multidrug transporter [Alteromonas macleodii]KHT49957.1 multidrug transporter [Alteromonas macleodii]MAW02986.1 multidrug transporter [Alteromonas sp.]|tara:strand:- start:3713 stop:4588 length:876 start_codon:yes stop_codon:yes gene_type:complete
MSWILFTLGAVVMQTVRNALQSKLSGAVNTSGVTLSRFILAPPIALVYLLILYSSSASQVPEFSGSFITVILCASLLQIAATSLMVILFKQKNFAIGAGLAKSEALVAGVVGMLFFGSYLTPLGWAGIVIGAIAVFVLSSGNRLHGISVKTMVIGLACGTCFALTSLLVREASHMLNVQHTVAAAWVLLWVLCVQTISLSGYIALTKPFVFRQLTNAKKQVLAISTVSCLGSICWFTAMALQHVALVKTLGQLEVLLTLILSHYWLKNAVTKREIAGLLLIGLAAIFVMWA